MDAPALPDPIGATPGELACLPGLLLDLATTLYPRRVAVARGLLAMMGAGASEKVKTALDAVEYHRRRMASNYAHKEPTLRYNHARDLGQAIAKLEDVIFGLVNARLKRQHQLIPPMEEVARVA